MQNLRSSRYFIASHTSVYSWSRKWKISRNYWWDQRKPKADVVKKAAAALNKNSTHIQKLWFSQQSLKKKRGYQSNFQLMSWKVSSPTSRNRPTVQGSWWFVKFTFSQINKGKSASNRWWLFSQWCGKNKNLKTFLNNYLKNNKQTRWFQWDCTMFSMNFKCCCRI